MAAYIKLDPLVPIGRIRAWIFLLCGPGDGCDDPLIGTRYDPIVRERVKAARRHARVVRRKLRRMGRPALGESTSVQTTPRDPVHEFDVASSRTLAVADTRPSWALPDRQVSRAAV